VTVWAQIHRGTSAGQILAEYTYVQGYVDIRYSPDSPYPVNPERYLQLNSLKAGQAGACGGH